MSINILNAQINQGFTGNENYPSLTLLVVGSGNIYTKNNSFNEICRNLNIELKNKEIDEKELITFITRATAKILKQCELPFFITPTIEIANNHCFNINLQRVKGCEDLTASLYDTLLKIALSNDNEQRSITKNLKKTIEIIKEIQKYKPKGKNTLPLLKQAHERGIPWKKLWGNVYQFGEGSALRWFDSSLSDSASTLSTNLLQNKFLTCHFLRSHQFPVPKNFVITTKEQAILKSKELTFPLVIKPLNRDRGEGVTSLILTNDEVIDAFNEAQKYSKETIIEEFINGEDYRIHVMHGKAYRVRHRKPAGVIGNGILNITQLIEELNNDPNRGELGSKSKLIKVIINQETHRMLKQQQLCLNSIPIKGQFVRLRSIANVSVGGKTEAFPINKVHPDNIILAESAVKAVNIDIAAVDLITPDITKSWKEIGGGICEINHKPQFGSDAIESLLTSFFPLNGRIPSILNIGDSFDLTLYFELNNKLKKKNIRLGFATQNEAWLDKEKLPQTSKHGVFYSFDLLLNNRGVDVILANWDPSIQFFGLPTFNLAALIQITNVTKNCSELHREHLCYRSKKILTKIDLIKYFQEHNQEKIKTISTIDEIYENIVDMLK